MADAAKQYPFSWQGKDAKGTLVKGTLVAVNDAAVRASLRRQGLVPIQIRRQSTLFQKRSKITSEDIAIFSRQLATMMQAGIPLVQAFDIVANGHENPGMQKLLSAIKVDIESGTTLADALAKHPIYFDDLFVNLVSAGEQSGALETLLDKIAIYKEKTEAIKKKIKKALTYPTAVLVVAFIVTAVLLVFVIPQFESLFQGFGADLPAFTRMVIDVSLFVRSNGVFIVIALVAAASAFGYFKKRSRKFNHFLDKLILRVPVIGEIIRKAAIARFTRTLSTMFAAGVPLVEALESVAGATGNIVYQVATLEIRTEVATGTRLQRAMEATELFPNMVIQMVAVGEESGSLDEMCGKVADFYERDVDDAVDNLSSLLEPMIMAILGILVGGLVIAMYLPIFKLGAVV
ncbi:type II secretion system F family protein [Thioalkalivibrio sp. XN279]|uniref:type II secretion system F family protein n=1 Tax=Thioalkalivibrio sp. XN279 TaxID=2714953 RepID=UPI001408BDC8|nr:type II secretion system F family protein [Thioalkalivibrio sp. XN279]NHA16041.1 type II secretion system F family protein [Thioalkalivibrio sp. XN279]